jgi:CBS domain-containing protein
LLTDEVVREVEPLHAGDSIGAAIQRTMAESLPALPVVEEDGTFAGIFGEREFMAALFPGYLGQLGSSAMISRSADQLIERRRDCWEQTIRGWLTTDQVLVEDDYADTQVAELFLHHRVLVIPVATRGKPHAVIARSDFFRVLAVAGEQTRSRIAR